MTWGKLVAPGKAPPNLVPGPTFDTPWRASDHHSYPWIPSLGTAAALFTSSLIFSCNVSRPIKSCTLTWIGTDVRQNLKLLVSPFRGSHANGTRDSTKREPKQEKIKKNVRNKKWRGIIIKQKNNNQEGSFSFFVFLLLWGSRDEGGCVYI